MTLLTLLQMEVAGATAAETAYANIPESEKSLHLIDIIANGEPSMLITLAVLLILSVVSVYILVERYMTLSRASKITDSFIEQVKTYVKSGDVEAIVKITSKKRQSTASQVFTR